VLAAADAGFCDLAHSRAPPAYQRLASDAVPAVESSTKKSSDPFARMLLLVGSERAEPHREWVDKGEGVRGYEESGAGQTRPRHRYAYHVIHRSSTIRIRSGALHKRCRLVIEFAIHRLC
jgi:hypothetical protein